ncbi:MAG: stage V sporulation T C-terminal domain-containing protein [Clostridia bacterium]
MKGTGIVRKVDELGRLVIPKEIRKTLRVKEGDPIEIFVEKNGDIVLRRYSPMGDLSVIASQYSEILTKVTQFSVCITDNHSVIAINGGVKNDYLLKDISDNVIDIMSERAVWSSSLDGTCDIVKNDKVKDYFSQLIAPIICDGDVIGSVILFSVDKTKKITNVEYEVAQVTAGFLSKQMEI